MMKKDLADIQLVLGQLSDDVRLPIPTELFTEPDDDSFIERLSELG